MDDFSKSPLSLIMERVRPADLPRYAPTIEEFEASLPKHLKEEAEKNFKEFVRHCNAQKSSGTDVVRTLTDPTWFEQSWLGRWWYQNRLTGGMLME